MKEKYIRNILERYDAIVHNFTFFSMGTKNEFEMYFKNNEMGIFRDILSEKAPDYIDAFEKVMNYKKMHLLNMLIMKREKMIHYCEWLFPLLDELDRRTVQFEYAGLTTRMIAMLSECLLDVQHLLDWLHLLLALL